ncbi:hypothetical protein CEY11_21545 [Candidimonas nitroreducens]|uniref:Uncharacterized protein n=2 Tax=Candidimonas nitroreducens TaxID=683354 RepID=A0A225M709_9BURK|nr:hypothetical protein CEY11_21545 [Candidimonas nitroreducens]
MAAGPSRNADLRAQYQSDVAFCKSSATTESRATCMKEAGAAYEEAKRNRLVSGSHDYQQDSTNRCKSLPAGQQQDCMMQMSGQNTVTRGSVESGGILRETTITVPAGS